MLNIYFGDMDGAIYNTSIYFNNQYLNSWLDDAMAAAIIKLKLHQVGAEIQGKRHECLLTG